MMEVMYDIPSRADVTKCVVTKDVVAKKESPLLVTVEPKRRVN